MQNLFRNTTGQHCWIV